MELRELETFREVARTLSFTKTAASLNYAQSSVSAQIQNLEAELGVPLFDRLGRKIRLTDRGREFLTYCDRILDLTKEAKESLADSQEPSGEIRIGAPESLCVYRIPQIYRECRKRYPKIEFSIQPSLAQYWETMMREGVIDAGVVITTEKVLPNFESDCITTDEMLILAHPDHPLAQKESVLPIDLKDETFLMPEPGCNYRNIFERYCQSQGVTLTSVLNFSNVEAIKNCVIEDIGVTYLPRLVVAQELDERRLVAVNWAGRQFEVYIQTVVHKDRWISPTVQAFLDLAREVLLAESRAD